MRSQKPVATGGLIPGNIALHAIDNLSWPLLIIPPGTKFRQIRRTVLACDFKEIPESIPFEPIKSLVTEFRSHLYVLHINKMNESLNVIAFSDEFKRLREVMSDLHPVYRFSCNTDINGAINAFVEKNNFDLLILLPKKHYTPEKAYYKSYSRQLALHLNTPILSLHK